jgi:crossover junction endodeoxyribonuclease RuvC
MSDQQLPRVLGLDLSLTATGWCVGSSVVEWGIHDMKKLAGMERLAAIQTAVQEQARTADLIVLEDFAFGAKGQAVFEIAGLGYLIRYWLWKNSHRFVLVSPTQLKKFITGRGNVNKEIVIREVYRRWGHVVDDNNQADAIVLAYIGMALTGASEPTTGEQRAIVADLRKENGL